MRVFSPYLVLGFVSLQLVTGKTVVLPGIATGYIGTESLFDSETVQKLMENINNGMKLEEIHPHWWVTELLTIKSTGE